ncbi:MAG: PEP-CTERM sorting domain-containing protein [Phycisphaerae bacterium]|nr:PEP-CTERM sorting domain-containing protein [Phycisphaerae bacterium]
MSLRPSSSVARTGSMVIALAGMLMVSTSALGSTDKATWITEASDYVLDHMPEVDALMWFNNYKPLVGEPDWRIVPESPTPPDPNVINAYNNAWRNATRTVATGVYIDGAPADMTKIDWYENWIDPSPQARIGWYQSLGEEFPTDLVNNALAHGSKPHIVWQPYDSSKLVTIGGLTYAEDTNNGPSRLWEIANGDYDFRLMQWATALNDIQGEVEISFGHEGNGDWFSWGHLNNYKGNTADLYRAAFQHVVDKINFYNTAGNVKWVWTINASYQDDFTAAYPGDTYVDMIGMDGFNWNKEMDPNSDWDEWREFSRIFDDWNGFSTYQTLVPFDKPLMIAETGSNVPEPATIGFLVLGGLALMRRRR